MKYISQQSDRLSQAFRRIDELEKENATLRKEIFILRSKTPHSQKPSACNSEKASNGTTISKNYTRSTAASRRKETPKLQTSGDNQYENRRSPVTIGILEQEYIYKDGVPIPMDYRYRWQRPRYMSQETEASSSRDLWLCWERREREKKMAEIRKRRVTQKLPTPPISEYEFESFPPPPISEEEEAESPPTPPISEEEVESPPEEPILTPSSEGIETKDAPEPDLTKRSRLDESLGLPNNYVEIDSKSGLTYLRKAAEIAQEAIYEIGSSGTPGWYRFDDGPHLVRLGRLELTDWLGDTPRSKLARNGHDAHTIYYAILDVVYLRNEISHPFGGALRDPRHVDWSLRSVQRLAVVLGDEKRAFEVRKLRDMLRDEAHRSMQDLQDLYHLTLQPYSPKMQYKFHHVVLFKNVLRSSSNYDEQIIAVANIWGSQNDWDPLRDR